MLGGTAGFYGVLLGAVGAGAILGAFALPWLRQRLDADRLLLAASLCAAIVLGCLAIAPPKWIAVALLLALGAGWITALTTLSGVAQSVLPNWVRGRGLAVYLMAFNGSMAAGSFGWGLIAQRVSVCRWHSSGGVGLAIDRRDVLSRSLAERRSRSSGTFQPLARAAAGGTGRQ